MKSFLLFLCLTVFCLPIANAQTTMVLKNGEYIVCKDFEIVKNPDQVILEVEGKVLCYPVEKVRGFFKKTNAPFMYLMASGSPDDNQLTFDFLVRVLDGEINLGDHSVSGTPGSYSPGPAGGGGHFVAGSGGATYLYAEKGDMFGTVYEPYSPPVRTINLDPKANTKKNAINRIKAMTSDVPGFDQAADSLAKDWDNERVIALIKRYNLAKHKPAQNNTSSPSGVVTFYLKPTAKATSVKLIVDDTKEYELTTAKPAKVLIPDNEVVKVCLVSAAASDCQLLRGTRCCKRYLQVIQNDKKGKLEVRDIE